MRKLLADGRLPVADFEVLDAEATHTEDVMLTAAVAAGAAEQRTERP